jgi:riboflavin synthase
MFTGLIEELGILESLDNSGIKIRASKILEDLKIGDSVAINGVCLTVTDIKNELVSFHISETTRRLSNFKYGSIGIGDKLNLERAMRADGRFGGHIVSGHIDGSAKIIDIRKSGADTFFEFLVNKEDMKLIVNKGSIAIDGISLTISDLKSSSFLVTIIPETINKTNLKFKRVNESVNIEIDIIAKYLKNIIGKFGV